MFVKILTVFGLLWQLSAADESNLYCKSLNPQNSLNMDKLMGMWYGSEVINHRDESPEDKSFNEIINTCVVVHLSEIDRTQTESPRNENSNSNYNYNRNRNRQRSNDRTLKLIWDENGKNIEYYLTFTNSSMGFWKTNGPQRETMLERTYSQFTGTVQVIKAVHSQLVLTFCSSLPDTQLFTIILSRVPNELSKEDILGVKRILTNRGLRTVPARKVCQNGASSTTITFTAFAFLFIASVFSKNYF